MGTMASQISSLTIVYLTVYSDADKKNHQSSASLAFVWGIHWGPVNFPHKWPVTRKMFPFDDVIMWRPGVSRRQRITSPVRIVQVNHQTSWRNFIVLIFIVYYKIWQSLEEAIFVCELSYSSEISQAARQSRGRGRIFDNLNYNWIGPDVNSGRIWHVGFVTCIN